MTATALPPTPELIKRIKRAMDAAHEEWLHYRESGGRPSGKVSTRLVKRPIWEMGFDYALVYPKAHELGEDAEDFAADQLTGRGLDLARTPDLDFTRSEFLYDISWLEYREEHQSLDGFPHFKRIVLALESEWGDKRAVLYDFDKLQCARAALRVMVWDTSKINDGFELLESRLRAATGSDDGYWLLSGWGNYGFEHVAYHNGQRQN